ncbi:trypsin [Nitzschia inconspicua]|uniref:Trypsin n=1 Tax=Nitzschia inconspicua TaxID=303405 RepID=A0A9K3PJP1_9STRA|nr:trypsin [Nitzschia inconspicua]
MKRKSTATSIDNKNSHVSSANHNNRILLRRLSPGIRILLATVWAVSCFTGATADGETSPKRRNLQQQQRRTIVNGETVTNLRDYQFFVRSYSDSIGQIPSLLCGASLIHSDIILTAAHCQGAFNYGVVMFNPFLDALNWYNTVDLQIAHPDYYSNIALINNDIMVLRLSEPVTEIVPVRLNQDPEFPVPGRDVTAATGFGVTDFAAGTLPSQLQVGYLSPITNADCASRGRFLNVVLSADVLCVDPVSDASVCAGDSGGPLTVPLVKVSEQQGSEGSSTTAQTVDDDATAVQVGVISFGTTCEPDNVPDGMTRVSYFYDWIQEQICRHSRVPPLNCPTLSSGTSAAESFINQDAVTVELDFQHDFMAEETTFAVRQASNNAIKYIGPEYVPQRGERVTSTFQLFPGNYVFEVYDSAGTGMVNPPQINSAFPAGKWTLTAVFANGTRQELATGDENFEFVQFTPFEVPTLARPSQATFTDVPSNSPTVAPIITETPTAAATGVPTVATDVTEVASSVTTGAPTATNIDSSSTTTWEGSASDVHSSTVATMPWWSILLTVLSAVTGCILTI